MKRTLRVMLDSNAFDALALDDAVRARVEAAVDSGALQLVVTHVQMDELADTPDAELRRNLQRISVVGTYAAGGVPGAKVEPRFDMFKLCSAEDAALIEEVTCGNINHAEDAVILLSAKHERIPVVTNEKRLPKQCVKHGVEVMTTDELLARMP